jgi:hypothetical protein
MPDMLRLHPERYDRAYVLPLRSWIRLVGVDRSWAIHRTVMFKKVGKHWVAGNPLNGLWGPPGRYPDLALDNALATPSLWRGLGFEDD